MGYKPEEIDQVYDHRAIVIARKARMYDELVKNGDVAQKKVVKLQKRIVKPGARRTQAEAKADQSRGLLESHRKNPKDMNLAAARIQAKIGR